MKFVVCQWSTKHALSNFIQLTAVIWFVFKFFFNIYGFALIHFHLPSFLSRKYTIAFLFCCLLENIFCGFTVFKAWILVHLVFNQIKMNYFLNIEYAVTLNKNKNSILCKYLRLWFLYPNIFIQLLSWSFINFKEKCETILIFFFQVDFCLLLQWF